MSTWKKIAIGGGVVIAVLAIVGFTVYQSHKNVVTVQTGKAERQDLASVVSASGEIQAQDLRQHRRQCLRQDHQAVRKRRRPGEEGSDAGATRKCAIRG